MKFTKEERLAIGRKIYSGEISKYEASEQYDINFNTARDYMRLYRDANHLEPKKRKVDSFSEYSEKHMKKADMLDFYAEMSKEELISEMVKLRKAHEKLLKQFKSLTKKTQAI